MLPVFKKIHSPQKPVVRGLQAVAVCNAWSNTNAVYIESWFVTNQKI